MSALHWVTENGVFTPMFKVASVIACVDVHTESVDLFGEDRRKDDPNYFSDGLGYGFNDCFHV